MDVLDATARRRISSRQLSWLERESRAWQESSLIDPAARAAILDRYTAISAERRAITAMTLLAAGMGAVGLLLLIGYNWDQIPRLAKLAIVIGAVAAAFAASAFAYARQRPGVAETLAFFGTLLFGNAIWLVAQVLHIEGRYPDAFLWWGVGALACAWLVRSEWIGALGAAIVLVWVGAEGDFTAHPSPVFVLLWPLAIGVAYSLRSSLMIRVCAPAAALWIFFGGTDNSHTAFWLGGIALVGCGLYGLGRWHEAESRLRRAWESSGLLVLLLAFIPLMFSEIHRGLAAGGVTPLLTAGAVVSAVAAGIAVLRPSRTPADRAVLGTAVAVAVWAVASWSGLFRQTSGFTLSATVLFSVLTLVMAVALIRTALLTDRAMDLGAGVAFALAFLAVRWASIIQNLFWSGLLLLAAAGSLLAVVRLWRGRAHAVAGRAS